MSKTFPPNSMKTADTSSYFSDLWKASVVENVNVWINVYDRDLNLVFWNATAEKISGYSKDEVIGNNQIWVWHYPDEEYRNRVLEQASNLVKGVTADSLETQIVCKDGSVRTMDWYSRTLVDADDRIQGAIVFGYDITDRKKAEEALKKAHKELSAIYNIASATSGAMELETALERSLEQVLPVMKSSKDFIHLWQEDAGELQLAASKGIHESSISDLYNLSVERGIIGRVFRQETPIAVPNVITELDDAPKNVPSRLFHSYLGVPLKAKGKVIGTFSILGEAERVFSNDEISLLTSIGEQIGVAVENARLYNQSRKLAVAEERRRLARELHDAVTQSLYSLTLFAETGQRALRNSDYDDAESHFAELSKTAQSALREMRLLLYELRPLELETEGLLEAVQFRLDAVERRSGIKARLIAERKIKLPLYVEQELYRIVQEALNNALKHSSAGTVTVSVESDHERRSRSKTTGSALMSNPATKGNVWGWQACANERGRWAECWRYAPSKGRGPKFPFPSPGKWNALDATETKKRGMMSELIRILIAEDHDLVRRGLRALISTEAGMEIIGEASNGQEAVALAEELKPDVILLDLIMPQMGGLEAIGLIKKSNPQARILVLTSFSDDDKVFPALKAGALGYLLKDSSPVELLQAIRHVRQGESSLAPSIALKLVQEVHRPKENEILGKGETLTVRELEVLEYLAQGLTNQEIAGLLVISERTVRNHVGSILGKLHLVNRTQAALYALREGISKLE